MATVIIVLDPEARILRWTCPCGQKNTHNGNMNKVPDDVLPIIEQAKQELLEDMGLADDPDAIVEGLCMPNDVWCIKCEEHHHTRADPNHEGIIGIGEDYE